LSQGVRLPALVTFIVGINPLAVLLVSLRRPDAHWSISKYDLTCGFLSLLGLLLWVIFQKADYAIVLAIVSDALASLPTYRKSISQPESEAWVVYAGLTCSAIITLLTVHVWTFANYAFFVYLALLGSSLSVIVFTGQHLSKEAQSDSS
jgi:hypothetical protein